MPKWEKPFFKKLPSSFFFQVIFEYELSSFPYCIKHKKGGPSGMPSWAVSFPQLWNSEVHLAWLICFVVSFLTKRMGPPASEDVHRCTCVYMQTWRLTYTYVGTGLTHIEGLWATALLLEKHCASSSGKLGFYLLRRKLSHWGTLCDVMAIVLNNNFWIVGTCEFRISLSWNGL